MTQEEIYPIILKLLQDLIKTPSLSKEEHDTADLIASCFQSHGISIERHGHNILARNRHWKTGKPLLLLNSHHDTVKPNPSWKRDPFSPTLEGDSLFGLGSNDAGGPLVCLIGTFLYFESQENLPWNLVLAASAEEEISGKNGIASVLPMIGPIDLALIGEPTSLQPAIAEKGLMVLDAVAKGVAGHAAREEGINAIYQAMRDIDWLRSYTFPQVSDFLGPVKMSVTQIEAGSQHNVVPDECRFVVDIRTNEFYSNDQALEVIRAHVFSELSPRSTRLNSSRLDANHPIVQRAMAMGKTPYGSPTLSDQALIPFPSLKLGPGDSARSHTADEYICLSELHDGLDTYIRLLDNLSLTT
ncbi:MAG: M20 family metallo-hydrolase [Bacteroidia bacterium]|nr:M20 family metallo-hydrolase [Bacteroidia bacterium]